MGRSVAVPTDSARSIAEAQAIKFVRSHDSCPARCFQHPVGGELSIGAVRPVRAGHEWEHGTAPSVCRTTMLWALPDKGLSAL